MVEYIDKQRLNKNFFRTCKPFDEKVAISRAQTFEEKAKFIRSELERLSQSEKSPITHNMSIVTNSRPINPFTDSHFYDDREPGE